MQDLAAAVNHRTYSGRKAVAEYVRNSRLFPAERVILDRLLPEIEGKRLLDIGVGGGRMTPALLEISRDYSAIDYSPGMVEATRKKFGLESVWRCDARDMSRFGDSSFDFVLFAWNGIDYVPYQDRPLVIGEVARVLRPGGIFMFASHNRGWRDIGKLPWQRHTVSFTQSEVREWIKALLYLRRHLWLRRYEVYTDEYAIVNDNTTSYSLLTCYVTISSQIRELVRFGFGEVQVHEGWGKVTTVPDLAPWVNYVARKHRDANSDASTTT
jgi:ubiquinone/menaquinone biosynthesis C-methylase UbiE